MSDQMTIDLLKFEVERQRAINAAIMDAMKVIVQVDNYATRSRSLIRLRVLIEDTK